VQARSTVDDDARVRVLTRQIGMTGLAIPFLMIAFVIGLELAGSIS
jgi:hypothetical protein